MQGQVTQHRHGSANRTRGHNLGHPTSQDPPSQVRVSALDFMFKGASTMKPVNVKLTKIELLLFSPGIIKQFGFKTYLLTLIGKEQIIKLNKG